MNFYRGDTLQTVRSQVRDKTISLIYINPPFGTTRNVWDEKQDWVALFDEFFRVLKDDGMLVIHCSIPFNYELIRAAPKPPAYSWYWKKEGPTCPLIANHQPLRLVEEILVWKKKKNTYYRQQIGTDVRVSKTMNATSYYMGNVSASKKTTMTGKTRTHLIDMKRNINGFSTRPDEIVQLMIDSYSKPGDTVLDCFCYKGLTSTSCKDRRWIGIDKHFYPEAWFGPKGPPLVV
jgi:site-specific DNA-methyltransferase (adenine-specific)